MAFAASTSLVAQSSLPVRASIARKRASMVAPMNTRPPAVAMGPPRCSGVPVLGTPSASSRRAPVAAACPAGKDNSSLWSVLRVRAPRHHAAFQRQQVSAILLMLGCELGNFAGFEGHSRERRRLDRKWLKPDDEATGQCALRSQEVDVEMRFGHILIPIRYIAAPKRLDTFLTSANLMPPWS